MEPEQVRNIMDSMIRKLYDMELEELGRSGWQDEKLLSEVRKLLENMHKDGKRLAIATGKSREGMKRVFNATGIEHLFECVQTADTNFSKPNPGMLLAIADESGLETKDM